MPSRRGVTGPPREQLRSGEWPHGETGGPAAVAQVLARRLVEALGGTSVRQVARSANLRHATVLALLNGDVWPDFVTIVKLEDTLEVDLWPHRHG